MTEQVRYNFFVPPALGGDPLVHLDTSYPVPPGPVTPFPRVCKYLSPDRASERPPSNSSSSHNYQPSTQAVDNQTTIYGELFDRDTPPEVFFGADPAPYVEVRCSEVIGCIPPVDSSHSGRSRPITLVRGDGVIYPTSVMYESS